VKEDFELGPSTGLRTRFRVWERAGKSGGVGGREWTLGFVRFWGEIFISACDTGV